MMNICTKCQKLAKRLARKANFCRSGRPLPLTLAGVRMRPGSVYKKCILVTHPTLLKKKTIKEMYNCFGICVCAALCSKCLVRLYTCRADAIIDHMTALSPPHPDTHTRTCKTHTYMHVRARTYTHIAAFLCSKQVDLVLTMHFFPSCYHLMTSDLLVSANRVSRKSMEAARGAGTQKSVMLVQPHVSINTFDPIFLQTNGKGTQIPQPRIP